MFSKALFKQSCKANGTMWGIITFAVCFMLACVMLISGNGNIGEVKNSIQDTIITKEIDAQMEKRALSYYATAEDGLMKFDSVFSASAKDTLSYLVWCSQMPSKADFADVTVYAAAMEKWQSATPEMNTEAGKSYAAAVNEWMEKMPQQEKYTDVNEYLSAVNAWQEQSPATQENAVTVAYSSACEGLQDYLAQKAKDAGYAEDSSVTQEILGSVMYTLNPNGTFNDFYTENGEDIPADYDFMSLISHISSGDIDTYLTSDERNAYYRSRAEEGAAIFLAGNMTKTEAVETLMDTLSDYGVTKEKYDSFGYTYDSMKYMAQTAIVTYQGRLEYELDLLGEQYETGEFENEAAYLRAIADKKKALLMKFLPVSFQLCRRKFLMLWKKSDRQIFTH